MAIEGAELVQNDRTTLDTNRSAPDLSNAPSPSKIKDPVNSESESDDGNAVVKKDNSLKVNQSISLLEGKRSFGASFMSFFGKDSTFIQLQKKIDLLNTAKTPADRNKIKTEVLSLGQNWLAKHVDVKNENDQKKRDSIQKIVDGLKTEKSTEKKDSGSKEMEIVSMSDKSTFGEKVMSAITGNESEFMEIETEFANHLVLAQGKIKSLELLFNVVKSAKDLKSKVESYSSKIEKSTSDSDIQKLGVLNKIKTNLGAVSFDYNINKNILVSATDIDLSKALEAQIVVDKAQIFVTFNGDKQISGEVNGLQLSKTEASFTSAKIEYNQAINFAEGVAVVKPKIEVLKIDGGYDVIATGGLEVAVGERVNITAAANVVANYNTVTEKWGVEISDCSITGDIDKIVNFDIKTLNYKDGVLSAATATASMNYNEDKLTGSISDVSVSKDGINWGSASLTHAGEIGIGNAVSVKNASAEIKGKKDNYHKKFSGGLTLDFGIHSVGSITASGDVQVTQVESGWNTIVSNGSLAVDILDGLVHLDASGINYAEGKLTIQASELKLITGLDALPNIAATGKEISYSKEEGFDWAEISLGNLGEFSEFEIFKFKVPDIKWLGKKDNYKLRFENGEISSSAFNGNLSASGMGTIVWDYKAGKPIEFESASLGFKAETPDDMPSSYLPDGIWPFKFDFSFPVVPLAGIHAGFGLEFYGGTKISVTGNMDYLAATGFNFTGKPSFDVTLGFGISVFAGAGIPNIAQLDAYASAGAETKAKAELELNSSAKKKEGGKGFDFSTVSGTYNLSATAKAVVKAGIRAKALMIFEKKIYEIYIGEWNLGEGKKTGVLGLGSESKVAKTEAGSTGFFAKNVDSPFQTEQSDYLKKLNVLSIYLPKNADTSPGLTNIDGFLNTNAVIEPVRLEENFNLAKQVMDKVPKRTDAMLSVLNDMEARKQRQFFIWQSNKDKRLAEYKAIKANVSEIQTRTTELGGKIKASLTLQDKTEITDFIREYSTKLVQLEEQLTHAKVNFETIEQRSEG
jgi:hypothetical protein